MDTACLIKIIAMKTIFFLLLSGISLHAQNSRFQAEPLKMDWLTKIEAFEEDDVTGILIGENSVIVSQRSSGISGYSLKGGKLWSSLTMVR
jgi:hypothetical protein